VSAAGIFATWAPKYRESGFWPRPIRPGSKGCFISGWQRPDPEVAPKELDGWLSDYAFSGIGLVMGSPFPDGSRLGAVDVDRDEYVGVVRALLQGPQCGRIGSKGAVFFVRVADNVGNHKFRVKGKAGESWGQVVECLFELPKCINSHLI
jgi:hypothetical protein